MPTFVPYFAVLIFIVFGIGFYLALISFRNASDKDYREGREDPEEKK